MVVLDLGLVLLLLDRLPAQRAERSAPLLEDAVQNELSVELSVVKRQRLVQSAADSTHAACEPRPYACAQSSKRAQTKERKKEET
eukprot:2756436-Rhodomonas_salina.1